MRSSYRTPFTARWRTRQVRSRCPVGTHPYLRCVAMMTCRSRPRGHPPRPGPGRGQWSWPWRCHSRRPATMSRSCSTRRRGVEPPRRSDYASWGQPAWCSGRQGRRPDRADLSFARPARRGRYVPGRRLAEGDPGGSRGVGRRRPNPPNPTGKERLIITIMSEFLRAVQETAGREVSETGLVAGSADGGPVDLASRFPA